MTTIISGKITALENTIVDNSAYLFIATENAGLHIFDPLTNKLTLINSGLPGLGTSSPKRHITDITSVTGPEGKTKLYVTTWDDGVYTSNDAGKSWSKQSKGLTKAAQANSKKYKSAHFRRVVEATASQDIYVAGFDGLFKWSNQSSEWQQMETRPVSLIKGFGISKTFNGKTSVGLATYGGGGYFTEDNGSHWIIANNGLRTTRLTDITYSPEYWIDSTVYSGAHGALLKSTSGGADWNRVETDPTDWKYIVRGYLRKAKLGWLSNKLFGQNFDIPPYPTKMAISPGFLQDKKLFYGTRKQGVYRSLNAGESIQYSGE